MQHERQIEYSTIDDEQWLADTGINNDKGDRLRM